MTGMPQLERRAAELLESYEPKRPAFDELVDATGVVRPRWRRLLEQLGTMSEDARRAARLRAERMLRENGVTFVAQDDGERTHRPWRLDLFPLLIDPAEWAGIEKGLIQRARLLNATLVDLYGPRRALKERVLPPAVLFGNPQFLRPCANVRSPSNQHLHFLAFDLARGPDGRWWVLSDRTQMPSGAGYALENRIVASQCLPELFGDENVRRLASFFRAFAEHFVSLAGRDDAHAVFLSPGPSKQSYFEHAYLARYLGFSVVEGSDLTVRDDRLYLKTVEGLKPVDLVMRRVSSELCDPLELRADSLLGVPGLLQAARAGRVTIGNAIGSGLVESDAFLSFLPALCRFHLGEELAMPSIATWWCGQARERAHVIANLDRLVLRRISTTRSTLGRGREGLVRTDLTGERRQRLIRQIEHEGYDFVGQEVPTLSTAPIWNGDGALRAAPTVLRVYVAATADGYRVMPGGLARIAFGSDPRTAWLQASDISKDAWVLSEEPVDSFSLLAQQQDPARIRRSGRSLPSRTADNLYWLGRYAERAEAAVRLFRSLVVRLGGEFGSSRNVVTPERVVSLLVVQKHLSARRGRRATQAGKAAVERELWTILFDPECRDGLVTVLRNVRRTADVVRERLSFDAFQILKDLTEMLYSWRLTPGEETGDALRLLNRLIQYLAAFSGLVMENMTRGYGWRFLDMGRRSERLRAMLELLQQLAVRGDPAEDGGLELLLELADSTMTYRARYRAAPRLPAVLDLLLCDGANPRSAVFQVEALAAHLAELPHAAESEEGVLTADERITTRLGSELRLADPVKLGETLGRSDSRVDLDRLLRRAAQDVDELADHIAAHFFSHSAPTRVSGALRAEGGT